MTEAPKPQQRNTEQRERKPINQAWQADQLRKQKERRCYVCGAVRDAGGCHGINGEMYECPWY